MFVSVGTDMTAGTKKALRGHGGCIEQWSLTGGSGSKSGWQRGPGWVVELCCKSVD